MSSLQMSDQPVGGAGLHREVYDGGGDQTASRPQSCRGVGGS